MHALTYTLTHTHTHAYPLLTYTRPLHIAFLYTYTRAHTHTHTHMCINLSDHEYYDGAELGRYLNQTWEGWGPIAGGNVSSSAKSSSRAHYARSTATSRLGALLTMGNHHAGAVHGSVPSDTSRFFSVDFGLVHVVAIDLNAYYGDDPCGRPCQDAQLDWLKRDLAAANANRANVPWVVVATHYPMYCTGCNGKQMSAEYYASTTAEFAGLHNTTAQAEFEAAHYKLSRNTTDATQQQQQQQQQRQLSATSDAAIADLMPVIVAGKVDLFAAGHWHYYESLYPAPPGKTGTGNAPSTTSFVDPKWPVHVTSGNGGPPGKDTFVEDCPGDDCGRIPSTRFQSNAYGYGRLVAHNASHLTWTQVAAANSTVVDTFTIIRTQ